MKKVVTFLLVIFSITACKKNKDQVSKTGIKLVLMATNTYDFDDIKVRFQSVEYQSTSDSGTSWKQLPLIDTSVDGFINIHTILHGNGTILSNAETPASHIKNLRIKFDSKAFVSKDGVTSPLTIPADLQQNGIIVPADYTMANGQVQTVVLVYNTNRSISATATSGSYTFAPNLRTYDPAVCGNIEGYVKPDESKSYVTLYTDTIASPNAPFKMNEISVPYSGGYFKLFGVPVGKYNVALTPLNITYTGQSALNVNVAKKITTSVGIFTLKN